MRAIDHEHKAELETWSRSVLWPIKTSLEYLTGRPFRASIDLLHRGVLKGNDQEQNRFETEVIVSRRDTTLLWCGENAPQRPRYNCNNS